MVHNTSSAFFLPRATRAASGRKAMGFGFRAAKYSARSSMSWVESFATVGAITGGAGFGLALARGGIGVRRRNKGEEKSPGESSLHRIKAKKQKAARGRPLRAGPIRAERIRSRCCRA